MLGDTLQQNCMHLVLFQAAEWISYVAHLIRVPVTLLKSAVLFGRDDAVPQKSDAARVEGDSTTALGIRGVGDVILCQTHACASQRIALGGITSGKRNHTQGAMMIPLVCIHCQIHSTNTHRRVPLH